MNALLWLFGFIAILGVVLTIRGKLVELRENCRGWRLWVRAPFFRYLGRDSNGKWASLDFKAHWEYIGHGCHLRSVQIPSAANWFATPEWAVSRREEIIEHLKEEYPKVVFIHEEQNQALEPTPMSVTPPAAQEPRRP
ncbi:MAG: hypothetical protein ABUL61_02810 [Oleiharenicola lentus]